MKRKRWYFCSRKLNYFLSKNGMKRLLRDCKAHFRCFTGLPFLCVYINSLGVSSHIHCPYFVTHNSPKRQQHAAHGCQRSCRNLGRKKIMQQSFVSRLQVFTSVNGWAVRTNRNISAHCSRETRFCGSKTVTSADIRHTQHQRVCEAVAVTSATLMENGHESYRGAQLVESREPDISGVYVASVFKVWGQAKQRNRLKYGASSVEWS